MGQLFLNFFLTQFWENWFGSQETFIKPVFFWENCFYSNIYISTLLFYYIHIMVIHLCQTPPNMSSFGAVCDRLGKTFLLLLVDNLGATVGLRVNSSPVKVKLIIFPLFQPERNTILPMTAKEVCALGSTFSWGSVENRNIIQIYRLPRNLSILHI